MEKLIPKLRFPEFKGEWEKKKIEDFAPLQRGFDLPVDNIVQGEYPVVFSNGILKFHNEFKSKGPGVVTGRSGTIGKVTYVEENFWPHNTSLWVTDFKNNYPKFVYYFYYSYNLERFGTGSGVPTLNRNDVHIQLEKFPPFPEQQKIAIFLTSVDEKLQALKKKKILLEQYKKGVMQKIFSQELRFKDENGNDFPKWEEKTLGEVLSLPEKIKPLEIDKNKLLTVKLHLKGVLKNESTESLSIGATSYYLRKKGQFIYGKQNLFNGAFGIIPEQFDGFLSSGDVPSLDINNTKINSDFLFYFMGRETFYEKLEDVASGSGSKRIHEDTLFKVEISLPSISEQTYITNFVSAIDVKINHCGEQIAKMEVWKKGLLQGMFC
ncbi:MAG: hypothetical protein RL728_889 [Bacteroidota bacterium]|jgi:restriction endonuclease S subunit